MNQLNQHDCNWDIWVRSVASSTEPTHLAQDGELGSVPNYLDAGDVVVDGYVGKCGPSATSAWSGRGGEPILVDPQRKRGGVREFGLGSLSAQHVALVLDCGHSHAVLHAASAIHFTQ